MLLSQLTLEPEHRPTRFVEFKNTQEERSIQEFRGLAGGARVDVDRQLTYRDRSSVESRERVNAGASLLTPDGITQK